MITKLEQLMQQREEIAREIKEKQKERKRLNNAIAKLRYRERLKNSGI